MERFGNRKQRRRIAAAQIGTGWAWNRGGPHGALALCAMAGNTASARLDENLFTHYRCETPNSVKREEPLACGSLGSPCKSTKTQCRDLPLVPELSGARGRIRRDVGTLQRRKRTTRTRPAANRSERPARPLLLPAPNWSAPQSLKNPSPLPPTENIWHPIGVRHLPAHGYRRRVCRMDRIGRNSQRSSCPRHRGPGNGAVNESGSHRLRDLARSIRNRNDHSRAANRCANIALPSRLQPF